MHTSSSSFGRERDPGRIATISVVTALHLGAVYAIAHWGFDIDRPVLTRPLQVSIIATEDRVESDPRPLPMPDLALPTMVQIEAPLIDLPRFDDAPTITVAYKPEPASAPVAKAAEPKLVSTVEYLEPLRPKYPPTSRRMREEGTVVLLVLVDEKGRASRIEVRDSSGHPRLDRAAQEAVHCARFKPYMEAGRAQPALVLIPVEFSLTTRVAQR
jgi:protein TonB